MSLRGIVVETLKLPAFRWVARRAYDRFFERQRIGNHYRGVYRTRAETLQHITPSLTAGFNSSAAAAQFRNRAERIKTIDYPVLFWVSRLLDRGHRSIFDLGGHFGFMYYSFRQYFDFPADIRWTVCDVPLTVVAGREWAQANDSHRQLTFTENSSDANGHDLLLVLGTLQYLDYSLDELLAKLDQPPAHILVNVTPMHPTLDFYTVQNMGFAFEPYHIISIAAFEAAMQARGYAVVDRWKIFERDCRIPFNRNYDVEFYSGFYLQRIDAAQPATR